MRTIVWKKRNRKDGFTLIELIVVLVVIAILAMVAIPVFSDMTGSAENIACAENRGQTERFFQVYLVEHPEADPSSNTTFEGFISEVYGENDFCPKAGNFSLSGAAIRCSVHGIGAGAVETDPTIIALGDGGEAKVTGTWVSIQDTIEAAGSAGYTVPAGGVYVDKNGDYYVVTYSEWLGPDQADTELASYAHAVPLITDSILTTSNMSNAGWIHWISDFTLTPGMVRKYYDNNYYVYIGSTVASANNTYAGPEWNWQLLTVAP